MTDTPAPERIWLQDDWDPEFGQTWCAHQVHDSDVEYVRADLAAPCAEAAVVAAARAAMQDDPEDVEEIAGCLADLHPEYETPDMLRNYAALLRALAALPTPTP